MVATLYGEKSDVERKNRISSLTSEATVAMKKFEENVRSRQEFKISFCSKLFYSIILRFCCCCLKSKYKAQAAKYRKFEMAV